MQIVRCVFGALLAALMIPFTVLGDGPSKFVVPKTKEAWDRQKADLAAAIAKTVSRQSGTITSFDGRRTELRARLQEEVLAANPGFVIKLSSVLDDQGVVARCVYVSKTEVSSSGPRPAIILFNNRPAVDRHAWFHDLPAALDIARRGMAVLCVEVEPSSSPWDDPKQWSRILYGDACAFEYLRYSSEVDPKRIGVLGIGLGGTRAIWLMAFEPSIARGMAIGGLTRLTDWTARNASKTSPDWVSRLKDGHDLEAVVVLCAGRPLEWTVGDRDPSSPMSGVSIVDNVGKAMDRLVDGKGVFHVTYLGRQDDHYGRLQWMGAMEFFEKGFFPQTATPLGHAPKPEPQVTGDFVDLAANGLAGWVVEMSQRPGTWTWIDGVIACKPGANEYGWLRSPIEVSDFILSIEWKVPANGNSGIFLRAKPVPWTFPPSGSNKRIVSTLGLDWPSRTGLELQAADDHGHADKYTSGSLYRHAAPAANPTNPAGHWNKYTVRARGNRVEVWTNGTQVLDTSIDQYPLTLANPPLTGYIGLRNHGAPAEFRNVKLLRLNR
jgi:hypothetical protein